MHLFYIFSFHFNFTLSFSSFVTSFCHFIHFLYFLFNFILFQLVATFQIVLSLKFLKSSFKFI